MRHCGISEQFATKDAEQANAIMRTKRPKWCLQGKLRQFTDAQLRQYIADAFGYWSEVCDLVFVETNDRSAADIIIEDHDFGDGPGGVLADAQLPGPRQQLMRLGREGNFVASSNPPKGTTDIVAILCHEDGHIVGLYHLPTGGEVDLMEPFYRPGLRKPQRAESAMVRQWYGAPVSKEPPPATPTVSGISVAIDLGGINSQGWQINSVKLKAGDKVYIASGIAKEAKAGQIVAGGLE